MLKKVRLIEHLFATRVSELLGRRCSLYRRHVKIARVDTKRFNFPETVPLVQWEDGSVRVRNSRVTLDTIVARMQAGDAAEEIHDSFPTVSVIQINEILAWYFDNKAEADEFLEQNEAEAEEIWKRIESDPDYQARRAELHRRIAEFRKT